MGNKSQYYRLRLALAEDRVSLAAPNGIRVHEMVVRAMPGGSEGIDAKDGRLSVNTTVSIDDIRKKLDEYLKSLEKEDITFAAKPLELKNLHLVALVQDDLSKRIHQSAIIPVPAEGATASSPAATTQNPPADSGTEKAAAKAESETIAAPKPETNPPPKNQPAEPVKK